jgi:hypothetical protein
LDDGPDPLSSFLKHVVSTITSSSFLEIVILYNFWDEHCWYSDPPLRMLTEPEQAEDTVQHHTRFKAFREALKVRNFQLVLCANVWAHVGEQPVRMLEGVVADGKARREFEGFSSDPLVIYNPQRGRITYGSPVVLSSP